MNRTDKEKFVNDFATNVKEAQAFALMSFNKLKVENMTAFRLALRKKNVRVKVVKNTLAKRVFESTPFKGVMEHLTGPTLVAYGSGDPVEAAKAIWEWIGKEGFEVKVKAGAALGQQMTAAELEKLSKLPGRKELLVSFLWALKCHPTNFLYGLKAGPQKLGYALAALKEKKETDSST